MLRHKKRYPASWVPFGSFIRIFTRNKHSQKLSEALASTSIIAQIRCRGIKYTKIAYLHVATGVTAT